MTSRTNRISQKSELTTSTKTLRLVLYSRSYCHLCQDMLTALESLRYEFDFRVTEIDVDSDPAAEQKYDELVPVLTDASGRELCHYYLDMDAVRAHLMQSRTEFDSNFG